MPNLRNGSKGGFEPGFARLRVRHSTAELPLSTYDTTSAGHHFSRANKSLQRGYGLFFRPHIDAGHDYYTFIVIIVKTVVGLHVYTHTMI